MSSSRQLVAIMFTDIVGYTALMGQDEQKAIHLLNQNRQIQKPLIEQHNGRWIKELGDGVMACFPTVSDAVYAALMIQKKSAETKVLQLRIGIHLGEVVFEDNDIFGDGVNIASRIQALTPPGGIWISEAVRHNVTNKNDILTEYVKIEHLKNVKEPVRIYRVIVEEEIRDHRLAGSVLPGYLNDVFIKPFTVKWVLAIVVFILIASVLIYFIIRRTNAINDKETLPKSLLESRIAVIPFENKTNDSSLDKLGNMAADWIIRGLMSMDEVDVVSYQTIYDNLAYVSTGNDFVKRTGAQSIIKGSIYNQGSELIIQCQFINGQTGEIEFAIPEVKGTISDLQGLINRLRQRIMTKFILEGTNEYYEILLEANPPTYNAFKYYEQAVPYYGVDYKKFRELVGRSIKEDSAYAWAFIHLGFSFLNEGKNDKVDSMLAEIDYRFHDLTFYEKSYLGMLRESNLGNIRVASKHAIAVFKKDPKQIMNIFHAGYYCISANRPVEAVHYFSAFDPSIFEIKWPQNSWMHIYYAMALIRLDRLDDAHALLNYVPYEIADPAVFSTKAFIFLLMDQQDSLDILTSRIKELALPTNIFSITCNDIAQKFAIKGDVRSQHKWSNLSLNYLKSLPRSEKNITWAMSLYLAGQFEEALKIYEESYKINQQWSTLSRIGCLYAKLGKRDAALAKAIELESMNLQYPKGRIKYGIARIYSALGDKEGATALLIQAFREGYGFNLNSYDYDFEFIPLLDYPVFKEFVRPKG